MNVLLVSPGFPAEMPLFTRALARVGARVLGLGDQPASVLEPSAAASLDAYCCVPRLWDEESVVHEVRQWLRGQSLDRIECLWEPGMLLAARLREALGVPGPTVEQTLPFRDKERMKETLDSAGIRTPRHARARSKDECREAAERIGYPLIIKPIAGAGSADTYPLHEPADLERSFELLQHVPEVSVEEFIDGEELTFDTVCAGGEILFRNVAWYRPRPLVMRLNGWISPQSICLRDLEPAGVQAGCRMGERVLEALGFDTGFAHMEWFSTSSGEAVFGEIGARPPGGRLVHAMNFSADIDLFTGWAEAVTSGRLSQDTRKRYNAAVVFKRAQGEGDTIRRIEGLESLLARYGEAIAHVELSPVGSPRSDWRQVIVGDGWLVARHPDLATTVEVADRIGTDLCVWS